MKTREILSRILGTLEIEISDIEEVRPELIMECERILREFKEDGQKVFKIRNRDSGSYSKGGWYSFNNSGKVWTNIGHLKNHLFQRYVAGFPNKNNTIPKNWEIVKFTLVESDEEPINAYDIYGDV